MLKYTDFLRRGYYGLALFGVVAGTWGCAALGGNSSGLVSGPLSFLALALSLYLAHCSALPGSADNSATGADTGTNTVSDRNWVQDAYLKASNAAAADSFGSSVALSGDILAVGAHFEDSGATTITNADASASADNAGPNSGAVYVFQRDINGDWQQDAYLKASNAGTSDYFGWSVAVSGDTIAVGAYREQNASTVIVNSDNPAVINDTAYGSRAGAVYIFRKSDGTNGPAGTLAGEWFQDAYLKGTNTEANDYFGKAVAIEGDTVVVGARGESNSNTAIQNTDNAAPLADNASAVRSGALYVFKRSNGTNGPAGTLAGEWFQDAYLKASNAGYNDILGEAISISGDYIVAGSHNERNLATAIINTDNPGAFADNGSNIFSGPGAAYIFKRDTAGNWSQDAYLKATHNNSTNREYFGKSVSISGDTVVVGAEWENSTSTAIVNTDNAAVPANPGYNYYAGTVFVFKRDANGDWQQDAYLKSANMQAYDYLGSSVAISGDTIVAGAFGEKNSQTAIQNTDNAAPVSDDNAATYAGAVYVFKRDASGNWQQDAYLKSSNIEANDYLGRTVAISGDTIVAGVKNESSNQAGITNTNGSASADNSAGGSGAVYVFKR